MLEPVDALSEPRPHSAGPITIAREHDDCGIFFRQPTRKARLLHARRKIDEKPEQFRG